LAADIRSDLTDSQLSLLQKPAVGRRVFLTGPAGTGKTTAAVEWLLQLLRQNVPGETILVLVPQRTLAVPYQNGIDQLSERNGGAVSILTAGGIARRMVELFWPLVSEEAGFAYPDAPPVFLTLETTQYYMARIVQPLLDQGLFSSVVIERNRLYSQVIDNLNKAAVVGFAYTEVGEKLKAAWNGEPGQLNIYSDAQLCANLFRTYCLEHNLLDFSLQVDLFRKFLWPNSLCREYLVRSYRHIIADNVEEDTPFAHDLLAEWLQFTESALVMFDQNAGYRRFLGADPDSALSLQSLCTETLTFNDSLVMSKNLSILAGQLGEQLSKSPGRDSSAAKQPLRHEILESCLVFKPSRFFPQMLDWTVEQIQQLITVDQIPPGEIAVLSPFLSDALRFSIINRLQENGIPARSHRPSRSLREEPVTQCLLTLTLLAHPEWIAFQQGFSLPRFDVAYALIQAIGDLDLIRAQILADNLYQVENGLPIFLPFERLPANLQERVSYTIGNKYETLRTWIELYKDEGAEELDHFLTRLFGELLAQPGFGFHQNFTAGEICANLIESIQKFRWSAGELTVPFGLEYLSMIREGVLAAQYIRSWSLQTENAVLIAPAYTFLMANRPVDVQVWLDPGNRSWVERIYQPLTHPYVLSRHWPTGRIWTDYDEVSTSEDALSRLVAGLMLRCRKKLYLGLATLGEQGYEQTGPLLRVFNNVLRRNQARTNP
jgi:superfamily I DNA/RNA helicase